VFLSSHSLLQLKGTEFLVQRMDFLRETMRLLMIITSANNPVDMRQVIIKSSQEFT
jgi:hypothetical protein